MKNLQNSASIAVGENNTTFVKLESFGNRSDQTQATVESKFNQAAFDDLDGIMLSDEGDKDKDNPKDKETNQNKGQQQTENESFNKNKEIANPKKIDAQMRLNALDAKKEQEVNYILENYSPETLTYIGITENSSNAIGNALYNQTLDLYAKGNTSFEKLKIKLEDAKKNIEQEIKDQKQDELQVKERAQRIAAINKLRAQLGEDAITEKELKKQTNREMNKTYADLLKENRDLKNNKT